MDEFPIMDKWREAHLKLSSTLPSRWHTFEPSAPAKSVSQTRHYQKRPVEVRGKRYDSVSEASKALGFGTHRMYKLFDSGEARYL